MTTEILSKAFDEAVRARAHLVTRAKSVLPDAKLETMSDREIRAAALKKLLGAEFNTDNVSDGYLIGAFDHAVGRATETAKADGGTSQAPSLREARAKLAARMDSWVPHWMRPTSVSRDQQSAEQQARLRDWQQPLGITKSSP